MYGWSVFKGKAGAKPPVVHCKTDSSGATSTGTAGRKKITGNAVHT
jgi:hypothetical protein